MTDQSLSDWRITITRAKTQSAELSNQLTQLGAIVNECPMIEIAPPSNWESLDSALANLESYDWAIFTSANAVEYFFKRSQETGKPIPSDLKMCGVGSATAKRLSDAGIRVDLVPSTNKAEGILESLVENIGHGQMKATKFLFPRAKAGRDYLVNQLRQLGAKIDLAEAYQTIRPECDPGQLSDLLKKRTDIIVFTSPSTIRNLADLVEDDLRHLLKEVAVAVIGPTTRQFAIEKGLSVAIEPARQTTRDLVDSIVHFAKNS